LIDSYSYGYNQFDLGRNRAVTGPRLTA